MLLLPVYGMFMFSCEWLGVLFGRSLDLGFLKPSLQLNCTVEFWLKCPEETAKKTFKPRRFCPACSLVCFAVWFVF